MDPPVQERSCPPKWQDVLGFCLFSLKRGRGEEDLSPRDPRIAWVVPHTGNVNVSQNYSQWSDT